MSCREIRLLTALGGGHEVRVPLARTLDSLRHFSTSTVLLLVGCADGSSPPPSPVPVTPLSSSPAGVEIPAATEVPWQPPQVVPADPPLPDPEPELIPLPESPVPLYGGTLLLSRSGERVFATEPEHDVLFVVDLEQFTLERSIPFPTGSRPVQLAEDAMGTLHVVLRGIGSIASVHPDRPEEFRLRPVCPAPRGITYDAFTDEIVVACKSGELVRFSGQEPARVQQLALDLRDVVASENGLVVSTFKNVEAWFVSRDEQTPPLRVRAPTVTDDGGSGIFEPHVATRSVLLDDGSVVVQHQRSSLSPIDHMGYRALNGCGEGVSHNAVSRLEFDTGSGSFRSLGRIHDGVPLDFAASPDGSETAALLSSREVAFRGSVVVSFNSISSEPFEWWNCLALPRPAQGFISGWPSAVAWVSPGLALVQQRSPPGVSLVRASDGVVLQEQHLAFGVGGELSQGTELFYTTVGHAIACATCHPEGDEDGTTWVSAQDGTRRTQPLAGRIFGTAPLHWNGDRSDMTELLQDTFVRRMSAGGMPYPGIVDLLAEYLDRLPIDPPPRAVDAPGVAEGRQWFEALGCHGCHTGAYLTDNQNHDVGKGIALQTPSLLGVAYRAPLMHDGCAKTLRERFGPCGGDARHGSWETLTPDQLDQLITYLESL